MVMALMENFNSILASPLGFLRLLDHFIRSRKKFGGKCHTDLFCSLQVDHKLKLRGLLHRQVSRFGTYQDLVHINSRVPKEVVEVRPVGHETALIDKLFLEVNSRQPVFAGELAILKTKSPEELREIHKAKLTFPGCRVIQEGPEG